MSPDFWFGVCVGGFLASVAWIPTLMNRAAGDIYWCRAFGEEARRRAALEDAARGDES